jgi:adenosine deaminase
MKRVTLNRNRLRALPKAELHRHLEGSVRFNTVVQLIRHHGLDLEFSDEEDLRRKVQIKSPMRNLREVLDCFGTTQKVLCSYEAVKRVSLENVEDAYREGVKLLELRFAPAFIAAGKDLDYDAIIEGVLDGITLGMKEYPIQVGLVGILPRALDHVVNQRALSELLRYAKGNHPGADRICGFDLADDEERAGPETFLPLIDRARNAGLGITVHTGENTDSSWVKRSLDIFKPDRIGHGIKIWGDETVTKLIREKDIMLEICPTSNWLTRSVASYEDHPLPGLYRNGIAVSINSDDPHLMDIDLIHEYEICVRYYHFNTEDFMRINRNTIRHSFLPKELQDYVIKKNHFATHSENL